MKVVLATANPGKQREFAALLGPRGFELVPQSQFHIESIAETGHTFEDNALLKARCSRDPQLKFVDLASTLLDEQGLPQPHYFQPDMLHLNPDGYAVWNAKLLPVLKEALGDREKNNP